jgi:hypothetical protein
MNHRFPMYRRRSAPQSVRRRSIRKIQSPHRHAKPTMDLHVGGARVEFPPGSTSIRKSRLSRSFFAFMGKDATHHRRPYTSRTPGRSTPNAGRNRKHQPSIPRLLEHRGTRRCRRASHCRRECRGAPRRRPGLQLLTRVTGSSPLLYQVSTLRRECGRPWRSDASAGTAGREPAVGPPAFGECGGRA